MAKLKEIGAGIVKHLSIPGIRKASEKSGGRPVDDKALAKAIEEPIGEPGPAREDAVIGWDFGPEEFQPNDMLAGKSEAVTFPLELDTPQPVPAPERKPAASSDTDDLVAEKNVSDTGSYHIAMHAPDSSGSSSVTGHTETYHPDDGDQLASIDADDASVDPAQPYEDLAAQLQPSEIDPQISAASASSTGEDPLTEPTATDDYTALAQTKNGEGTPPDLQDDQASGDYDLMAVDSTPASDDQLLPPDEIIAADATDTGINSDASGPPEPADAADIPIDTVPEPIHTDHDSI